MSELVVPVFQRPGTVYSVVGVTQYQPAIKRMTEGERVVLSPEPDNPYDSHAVAVRDRAGDTLGYLPRAIAARFTDSTAQHSPEWEAKIAELYEFTPQGASESIVSVKIALT